MKNSKRRTKPVVNIVNIKEAAQDLGPELFLFYLYLIETFEEVLKEGEAAFLNYWGTFPGVSLPPSEALKKLRDKGYIKQKKRGRKNLLPKIVVLKKLHCPVNKNRLFAHQSAKQNWKPHVVTLDPFDDPYNKLIEKVKPKRLKNKDSRILDKQTPEGHKEKNSSEDFSGSVKEQEINFNLETRFLKTKKIAEDELIPVEVSGFDGKNRKTVFLNPKNVFGINKEKKEKLIEAGLGVDPYTSMILSQSMIISQNPIPNKREFVTFVHSRFKIKGCQSFYFDYWGQGQGLKVKQNKKEKGKEKDQCLDPSRLQLEQDKQIEQGQLLVSKNKVQDQDQNQFKQTTNNKKKVLSLSRKRTDDKDNEHESKDSRWAKVVKDPPSGGKKRVAIRPGCDRVREIGNLGSAKKRRNMDLGKIKTRYIQEKKERVATKAKKKNLSEKDVWAHIKRKGLDIFSPQIDRQKLIKILDLPNKSSIKKELLQTLGEKFSEIYYAYRQKLEEASSARNTYSKSFGENFKHAKKAAEACIYLGVTPQFAIQYFHENRTRFNPDLKYVPISILSNAGMIDSAASSYLGKMEKTKFGNAYAETDKLHPLLRESLEEAGFKTQEYSDNFLMTIQLHAISISNGAQMFLSSDIKKMVHWAAENIFKKGAK